MIPVGYLLSTYGLKIICRINSLNQVDSVLFKDRAILEMVGFNGVHFECGFSRRNKGKHLPFNVSTLGKLLGDFSLSQSEEILRDSLALLGKYGFIGEGVFAADATPLYVSYTSSDYEKIGVIVKDGKKKRGYKLITLRYVGKIKEGFDKEDTPGIFVAGIVVPLNENESKYLISLIEQAIKNIGKERIKMIVADRGFLCGENLWEIKHRFKIDFLIYSKSNMDVSEELKKRMTDCKERKRRIRYYQRITFSRKMTRQKFMDLTD